jgi:hypothetical protein
LRYRRFHRWQQAGAIHDFVDDSTEGREEDKDTDENLIRML